MKFIKRIQVGFIGMKKNLMKTTAAVMAGAMLFGSAISAEAAGIRDVFDALYYSQTYSDLSDVFGMDGQALYEHYTTWGQKEGRNCNELVDVVKYRAAYPDLDAAFGDNWGAYLTHYLTCGIKEGRNPYGTFDAKAYADRYADLKAAFGYDVIALYRHYILYGRAEGRDASSPVSSGSSNSGNTGSNGGSSNSSNIGGNTGSDGGDSDNNGSNGGDSDSGNIDNLPVRVVNPEGGPAPQGAIITFTRIGDLFEEMAAVDTVSGNGEDDGEDNTVSGNTPGSVEGGDGEDGSEDNTVSGNTPGSVQGGNGVYTVYVGSDGTYNISNFEPGVYSVSVTAEGFMPLTLQSVAISSGASIPTFELLSTDVSGSVAVRGQVTDAVNGQPIAGVTVNIRANWNNRTGDVVATTVADENGNYSYELARGYYTIEFARAGYVSEFVNVSSSNQTPTRDGHLSVVADVNVTQYRIVLTWGETPRDLDSHLVGPTSNDGVFHVFYANKDYAEGNNFVASLDIDDTSSYGPETVTIINAADDKTYYYSVHDFTNGGNPESTEMAASGAVVKVYRGSTQVREYSISPSTSGNIWNVFKIENGRIVDIDDYNSDYDTMYGEYR